VEKTLGERFRGVEMKRPATTTTTTIHHIEQYAAHCIVLHLKAEKRLKKYVKELEWMVAALDGKHTKVLADTCSFGDCSRLAEVGLREHPQCCVCYARIKARCVLCPPPTEHMETCMECDETYCSDSCDAPDDPRRCYCCRENQNDEDDE